MRWEPSGGGAGRTPCCAAKRWFVLSGGGWGCVRVGRGRSVRFHSVPADLRVLCVSSLPRVLSWAAHTVVRESRHGDRTQGAGAAGAGPGAVKGLGTRSGRDWPRRPRVWRAGEGHSAWVVFAWPGAVRLDSVSCYTKRNTISRARVEGVKTAGVSVCAWVCVCGEGVPRSASCLVSNLLGSAISSLYGL